MSDLVLALKAEAEAGVRHCEPFEALTDCVSCGAIAVHLCTPEVNKFVTRICTSCDFEWRQFA
jgi:hypothetical protein